MVILAFDLGITDVNPTAIVVADVLTHKLFFSRQIKPNIKLDWFERIRYISLQVDESVDAILSHKLDTVSTFKPEFMAYELPYVMPKNAQTSIKLAHLGGALLSASARYNLTCYPITPTEAKKALTGKGNSDKEAMQAAAMEWLGSSETSTTHLSDAIGVALAAYNRIVKEKKS